MKHLVKNQVWKIKINVGRKMFWNSHDVIYEFLFDLVQQNG